METVNELRTKGISRVKTSLKTMGKKANPWLGFCSINTKVAAVHKLEPIENRGSKIPMAIQA